MGCWNERNELTLNRLNVSFNRFIHRFNQFIHCSVGSFRSFHVPFQPNQLEWWNGGVNILRSTYSVFCVLWGAQRERAVGGKTHRRHQTKIDFTDEIFFLRRLFLYPMEIVFDGSWKWMRYCMACCCFGIGAQPPGRHAIIPVPGFGLFV